MIQSPSKETALKSAAKNRKFQAHYSYGFFIYKWVAKYHKNDAKPVTPYETWKLFHKKSLRKADSREDGFLEVIAHLTSVATAGLIEQFIQKKHEDPERAIHRLAGKSLKFTPF